MKSKKIIVIVSILAAVSIIAYLILRRKKANAAPPPDESTDKNTATAPESQQDDYIYPWKTGTSGPNVKGIQRGLNMAYDAGLTEDGIFGPKTQAALLKYMEIKTITSYENRQQIIQILKNKIKVRKP